MPQENKMLRVRNTKLNKEYDMTEAAYNNIKRISQDRDFFELVTTEKPKAAKVEEQSEEQPKEEAKPRRTRKSKKND